MRITFLNQKGGVGKSTVSILVGAALHAAGYRVAFDDRDSQGSVTYWAREIGKLPLLNHNTEYDVILCDTPGRLDLEHESAQGFLQPIIAGASTYAVGRVFDTHFASGGTFLDFNLEKARQSYAELYQEAQQDLKALKAEALKH